MKKKYLLIGIALLFTKGVLTQNPQAPFQRGINVSGWFEFFSDVSEIQFNRFTKKDLENIQSLGCDHIRLPMHLFHMTGPAPDYTFDPLTYVFLDQVIDWAEELGLHLILDNHSFDPSVKTTPEILDQLLAVWTQLADRYKNRSSLIYFEILNEPHGIQDAVWNDMQQQVIEAIRGIDQTHTIIVGPGGWNSYNNLEFMPAYEDTNLIYTFHFYDPFLFTHQGASWTDPPMADLAGVPYPYDENRMPDLPDSLKGTWIESSYDNYPDQGNAAHIQSLIDIAVRFRDERQVPIWCGEFGAHMPTSTTEDRARWLETVRTYFEASGIVWTMWEYVSSFGIFEPDSYRMFEYDVNIPIIEALGLVPPPQSEFILLPDSTGFIIYDDYVAQRIFNNSWLNDGRVNYYCQNDPKEGNFGISWTGSERYGTLRFHFSPIHDFTRMLNRNYWLDFWVRCSTDTARIDVRFTDTDTENPDDHPWRMRITLDSTVADWDGSWQHMQLLLTDFTEHGAWEDATWYNPQGDFDWSRIENFDIVAEHHDLTDIEFSFDYIRIIGSVDTAETGIPSAMIPETVQLFQAYPNPFNPETVITFVLSDRLPVCLTVYNIKGQKVENLTDSMYPAGQHRITWNGSTHASGVYLVHLKAGTHTLINRVLLLR